MAFYTRLPRTSWTCWWLNCVFFGSLPPNCWPEAPPMIRDCFLVVGPTSWVELATTAPRGPRELDLFLP